MAAVEARNEADPELHVMLDDIKAPPCR